MLTPKEEASLPWFGTKTEKYKEKHHSIRKKCKMSKKNINNEEASQETWVEHFKHFLTDTELNCEVGEDISDLIKSQHIY